MENPLRNTRPIQFQWLKIAKRQRLTKNIFALEFEIPDRLTKIYRFEAGQYVSLRYSFRGEIIQNDFSMTSAPFEGKISLGIKVSDDKSSTAELYNSLQVGDKIEVSEPRGRFTIVSKPHEFRTIIGFAAGIGITPILSHFKNILFNEPRTRLFLFFGNRKTEEIPFHKELIELAKKHENRFEIFYFFFAGKDRTSFI